MNRILVVENDPVVMLDLVESLRAAYPLADVEPLTLEEAIARLNLETTLNSVALISSDMSSEIEKLGLLSTKGLKLALTNRLSEAVRNALPSIIEIERPFDATTLITALSRRP